MSAVLVLGLVSASFAQKSRPKYTLRPSGAPVLKLRVDKAFKLVGPQEFELYAKSKAQQYFFVESAGRRIKRLYMIQFEGYKDGVAGSYGYENLPQFDVNGVTFGTNAETIPDLTTVLKGMPESDVAHAVKFLEKKRFKLMRSLRYQRFARTTDTAQRNEIIIMYVEDQKGQKDVAGLKDRALAGITLLK